MIKILPTLFFVSFFLFSISLKSQCAETVTKETTVSFSALPNETIAQSFKTTCAGVLSSVKMTHLVSIPNKTTTVLVEDAQGNALATLNEQTVVKGENIYDFELQKVKLEANTTYLFRIKVIYGDSPMKISGINTDFYPKGNLFLNNNAYAQYDLVNWEVKLINDMGTYDYIGNLRPYQIAPNPSKNGIFEIKLRDGIKSNFEIYSVNGKKIISRILDKKNNVIDTGLPKGIYILKMNINGKVFSEKLIIK